MISVKPSSFGRLIGFCRRQPPSRACKHALPGNGRRRERLNLVDTVARDVEVTRRSALAHAVGAGLTILPVKFHGIDLQALHATARRTKWPTFTPPAAELSRRYRGQLSHRRSQVDPLTAKTKHESTGNQAQPRCCKQRCAKIGHGDRILNRRSSWPIS